MFFFYKSLIQIANIQKKAASGKFFFIKKWKLLFWLYSETA